MLDILGFLEIKPPSLMVRPSRVERGKEDLGVSNEDLWCVCVCVCVCEEESSSLFQKPLCQFSLLSIQYLFLFYLSPKYCTLIESIFQSSKAHNTGLTDSTEISPNKGVGCAGRNYKICSLYPAENERERERGTEGALIARCGGQCPPP